MIDDLRALAVFVAVADAGSFSQAGRRLKLSTSVVSHHIGRLEEKLRIPLFYRSTRSMSLTPEGVRMLDPARRMVAAGEEALETLTAAGGELSGELRITMPAFGDDSDLQKRVWNFLRIHSKVSMTVHKSDVSVDLVKEGYDLAIRFGEFADQTMVSKRIGEFHRTLVAAPAYLENRPPITKPEDLKACDFIGFLMLPDGFSLLKGKKRVDVEPVHKRIATNSIHCVKEAILEGLGMQRLVATEVAPHLTDGSLVQVLPDWSLPVQGVYAAWPVNGPQKAITKQLVDFLKNDRPGAAD
ncbi:MAG: LysR family transcriptional regulator [Pseudomonadota bacterium]